MCSWGDIVDENGNAGSCFFFVYCFQLSVKNSENKAMQITLKNMKKQSHSTKETMINKELEVQDLKQQVTLNYRSALHN